MLVVKPSHAHNVQGWQCERPAIQARDAAPNGERYRAYVTTLARCRAYVVQHASDHRVAAAVQRCRMPRSVCLGVARAAERKQAVPVSWTHDPALRELLRRESTWNPRAINPSSGACGLYQFYPCRWSTIPNVETQSLAGLRYIRQRYGTPAAALRFHNHNGWY